LSASSRESGTADSGDLEMSRSAGNVDQVAPKPVERLGRVCVRTLRTQQRTESQCQLIYRSVTHFAGAGHHLVHYEIIIDASFFGGVVVLARMDQVSSHAFGCALSNVDSSASVLRIIWHSMESLILAQDERWRRA